jgi:membrane protein YqaA with SNARE-associated domain
MALAQAGLGWESCRQPVEAFGRLAPALKLTVMGVYLSLATVFLPLPTPWLIAGLASPQSAVAAGLWPTVLLVAAVGAAGSTIANLNEYHMLNWIMRLGRADRLRHTRAYAWACRWFDRGPFFLLTVFNLLPLPVDAVRMLAAVRAYPRGAYAAANFVGRFGRYGVIAFVTYYWELGWVAVVALLGLSAALGLAKAGAWAWKRARAAEPAGR